MSNNNNFSLEAKYVADTISMISTWEITEWECKFFAPVLNSHLMETSELTEYELCSGAYRAWDDLVNLCQEEVDKARRRDLPECLVQMLIEMINRHLDLVIIPHSKYMEEQKRGHVAVEHTSVYVF